MDDIIAARANIQDEGGGFAISADEEIRFGPDDPSDDEVPHSNPSPQHAAPEQTEDLQSINAIEASSYDRPPALDPEDNQWKVERLDGKRRKGRTVEYLVKWAGPSRK
jgi:hypothetical protein